MQTEHATIPAEKILVVMPNWLGDAVMATPFLRALRNLYPAAHITALTRPLVAPVLAGLTPNDPSHYKAGDGIAVPPPPLLNDVKTLQKSSARQTLRWIQSQKFHLGILLPNSFRSAWVLWRGGIPHRLGYARDRRSLLLNHSLRPTRRSLQSFKAHTARFLFQNAIRGGDYQRGTGELLRFESTPRTRLSYQIITRNKTEGDINSSGCFYPQPGSFLPSARGYEPVPTIDYYLALAQYLGAPASAGTHMHLAVTSEEQQEADTALQLAGIGPQENLVVIVPGANFGSSKCWLPERFAQVADRIMDRPEKGGDFGAHVIVATSPSEIPIANAILAASMLCPNGGGIGRLHASAKMNDGKGLSVGGLKAIVQRSRLMICNDTGPRHFAAAFNIPAVTLFGPTDPVWAQTYAEHERLVSTHAPCSPCQLKTCPIDHRCMKDLTLDQVMDAVRELWPLRPAAWEQAQEIEDINPRDFA